MKCNISLYQYGPRNNEKRFGVQYGVEESEKGFIIELSDEILEEIKDSTLDHVHDILNRELYKQTGIAYGDKPED